LTYNLEQDPTGPIIPDEIGDSEDSEDEAPQGLLIEMNPLLKKSSSSNNNSTHSASRNISGRVVSFGRGIAGRIGEQLRLFQRRDGVGSEGVGTRNESSGVRFQSGSNLASGGGGGGIRGSTNAGVRVQGREMYHNLQQQQEEEEDEERGRRRSSNGLDMSPPDSPILSTSSLKRDVALKIWTDVDNLDSFLSNVSFVYILLCAFIDDVM
jgi:hypothetical protein